jgi:site-specific DNA-methyltransferase (adenine-specific)
MYGSGFPKHKANLKPAFEPIVTARKPYKGSLAANEVMHGTGALSIDATRTEAGRWPANVVLDETTAELLDEQSGHVPASARKANKDFKDHGRATDFGGMGSKKGDEWGYSDSGGASRFFYVAKAPKKERPVVDGVAHPTVKPLALMRWLVKLVTPPGGTVLEPFAGSGATVEACMLEGFNVIAIEQEADYLPLIQARIDRVA